MNYNRRANRPNGGHYREMRRRGLRAGDEGVAYRRARRPGLGTLILLLAACAAVAAGFFVWR